jgi:hypothetical protein
VVAAGGALVAAHPLAAGATAVHPRAAALAVDELTQQVLLGGSSGLDDPCAPLADFLHAVGVDRRDAGNYPHPWIPVYARKWVDKHREKC